MVKGKQKAGTISNSFCIVFCPYDKFYPNWMKNTEGETMHCWSVWWVKKQFILCCFLPNISPRTKLNPKPLGVLVSSDIPSWSQNGSTSPNRKNKKPFLSVKTKKSQIIDSTFFRLWQETALETAFAFHRKSG